MVVTASALLCLTLNVYYEARSEPTNGQLAVAYVTLNRAVAKDKPVCDIVYEKSQFSWTEQKVAKANRNSAEWTKSEELAKRAVQTYSKVPEFLRLVSYFHNDSVTPTWVHSKKRLFTIGNHHFYQ